MWIYGLLLSAVSMTLLTASVLPADDSKHTLDENGQVVSSPQPMHCQDPTPNPESPPQSQVPKNTVSPQNSKAVAKAAADKEAEKKESPYASFWPSWFQMGVSYRGRFEYPSGRGYAPDSGDGYYLSRARVEAALKAGKYVDFFAMTQDARVYGYDDLKTRPSGTVDVLDLRQAYIDIHSKLTAGSLAVRVGRQYLDFGSRRLVAVSAWGNSPPVFDAARLSLSKRGVSVDIFAATRISVIRPYEFNEARKGENIYGSYLVLSKLVPHAQVEPYLFWRTQPLVMDERKFKGDSDLVTTGLRFLGKLGYRFDYTTEVAVQRGTYAEDKVSAWAGSWGMGYVLYKSTRKPKLLFEYNYATGDGQAADGTRGTFDQLYPSNHAYYGIADQVGWRNTSNYKIGFEVEASRRLKIQFDFNDFYLATLQDALYSDNGSAVITNAKATSTHVGWEPDLQCVYKVNRQNSIGFGYGRLNPGTFLKQSSAGHPYNYPYLYWESRY